MQEVKSPEVEQARRFIKKIKSRYREHPHIYKQFLEILHGYHKDHHSIQDVYDKVSLLFRDEADLLAEFKQFLPDPRSAPEYDATSQQPALFAPPQQGATTTTAAPPAAPPAATTGRKSTHQQGRQHHHRHQNQHQG